MKIKNYYRSLAILCGGCYAAMGIFWSILNAINSSVLGVIAGFFSFSAAAYILITIWQDCKREKKLIEAVENYKTKNNWRWLRYLSVDRYGATIMNPSTKQVVDFYYDFDNKCFKTTEQLFKEYEAKEDSHE